MNAKDFLRQVAGGLSVDRASAALVVFTIGLGIGASMAMIGVIRSMSGDPAPAISDKLYYPHFDPSPPGFAASISGDPGESFTWFDANNLLRDARADKQAMVAGGRALVYPQPGNSAASPSYVRGRYVTNEFFDLFSVPFAAGRAWNARDDGASARVVVLNQELARRLFGNVSPLGKAVRIGKEDFAVTGVLESWHPRPLFYGGSTGEFAFKSEDGFFMPLSTAVDAETGIAASMTCWESGTSGYKGDGCAWLQYWVRLETDARRRAFADYLQAYWMEQRKSGRAMADGAPALLSLHERLQRLKLIPTDVSLQVWLTFALLAICVANAISLLMAKTLRRQSEISIRRAVGATRLQIIGQIGAEAVGIGLASGFVGVIAAQLFVSSIRQRQVEYASLVRLDTSLLLIAVATAIASVLVASIVPAIQAAHVKPSDNLKAL